MESAQDSFLRACRGVAATADSGRTEAPAGVSLSDSQADIMIAESAELVVEAVQKVCLALRLRPPVPSTQVKLVGRRWWVRQTIEDYLPVWERVVAAVERSSTLSGEGSMPTPRMVRAAADFPGGPIGVVGAMCGEMIGRCGERVLGQYDLPIPRRDVAQFAVLGDSAEKFASSSKLPASESRRWIVWQDAVRYVVLAQPAVREMVLQWIGERVRLLVQKAPMGFAEELDRAVAASAGRGAERGSSEPELAEWFKRLEGLKSRDIAESFGRLHAVIAATAWYLAVQVGFLRESTEAQLREGAALGLRTEHPWGTAAGWWFGYLFDSEDYEQGLRFVETLGAAGVSLGALWSSEQQLPRQSDLEEPRFWLERRSSA